MAACADLLNARGFRTTPGRNAHANRLTVRVGPADPNLPLRLLARAFDGIRARVSATSPARGYVVLTFPNGDDTDE